MEIIENIKLSELLGETVGVDKKSGAIICHKNGEIKDITNDILELVVLAIEDNQTFILWKKKINISVCELDE